MRKSYPKGVYPVMLTPFTDDNKIDYESLGRLIDWYIDKGCAGLFSTCQSSEMFFLSFEERVNLTKFVVDHTAGRIPVVASGHTADDIEVQAKEATAIAGTGIDCMVLLTNRFALESEGDDIWLENLKRFISLVPEDMSFGFYECPFPYKRVMTPQLLQWCADTGRFFFTKDTSCDLINIRGKVDAIEGTNLTLFNANTSTLLESLQMGAGGFSGVMANFHPELYVWLCANFDKEPEKARKVADFLTVASLIERQVYPVNAKYFQNTIGNFSSMMCRTKDPALLNDTCKLETEQLVRLTEEMKKTFNIK